MLMCRVVWLMAILAKFEFWGANDAKERCHVTDRVPDSSVLRMKNRNVPGIRMVRRALLFSHFLDWTGF